MKRTFVFLITVVWVAGGVGTLYADDSAKRLDDLLSTNTLDEFTAIVEIGQISAPVIPSQWFADRVATDVERVRISNARTFGSNLLERLDEYAGRVIAVSNLAQCAQHADVFLSTASWLGRMEGYGNAVLASHCHDLASVFVGHLLVDTNYPMSLISADMLRFEEPWDQPIVRARILDTEIGTNLFAGKSGTILSPRDLGMIWSSGYWRSKTKKGYFSPDQTLWGVDMTQIDTDVVDQHLAFFVDSEHWTGKTTRERWSLKHHEIFVGGLEPANVRMLRALARFRELVGEFPTSVPYTNHPFSSLQKAAFEYAWRPYREKEGPVYGLAYHAYQKITCGEFVDQDTAIVRMRNTGDGDDAK